MIKRAGTMEKELREGMRGGTGAVQVVHVFRSAELKGGRTRLFARLRLAPGSSIGYHVHEGEEEIFSILSGKGKVTEGGVVSEVGPGDAVLTGGGGGHSVECIGPEPLEMMAVILQY
jgi:mannose-6-phosphate isomerase-like protein (cupin superfamily)